MKTRNGTATYIWLATHCLLTICACDPELQTGARPTPDSAVVVNNSASDAAAETALPSQGTSSLEFIPKEFDFGSVPLGLSAEMTFKLVNHSSDCRPAAMGWGLGGEDELDHADFGVLHCQQPFCLGAVCEFLVRYSPKKRAYSFTTKITAKLAGEHASAEIKGAALGDRLPPEPRALVGYWSFAGVKGPLVPDHSGKDNNGTIVAGQLAVDSPKVEGSLVQGRFGKALDLSPENTWVSVPRSVSIDSIGNANAFTVAAWVNPKRFDDANYQTVIAQSEKGTWVDHFGLGFSRGKPSVWSHFFYTDADVEIPIGQWSHIAGTYDGVTLTIFLNGQKRNAMDVGWKITPDTTNVTIGGGQAIDVVKRFFGGLIDEVRLYNVALSEPQVNDLYQIGTP